jgi:hypothetical protein
VWSDGRPGLGLTEQWRESMNRPLGVRGRRSNALRGSTGAIQVVPASELSDRRFRYLPSGRELPPRQSRYRGY